MAHTGREKTKLLARVLATRISLILATIATIGLIALGTTSLDAAVRRMGACEWRSGQIPNTATGVGHPEDWGSP
jgi:DMSO/TMAO reductase YedYZ heme-binding membrane subunit